MIKMKLKKISLKQILMIIVLLGLIYIFRPWFHQLLMQFYIYPITIISSIIFILGLLYISKEMKKIASFKGGFKSNNVQEFSFNPKQAKKTIFVSLFLFIIFLVMINGIALSTIGQKILVYQDVKENSIEMTEFPEMAVNTRLMPMSVAINNIRNNLVLEQYKLGKLDFVVIDGKMWWNGALIPDGTILHFTYKPWGVAFIDATTTEVDAEKNIITTQKPLEIAEGIGITDSLNWNLVKEIDYWADYSDPFYIPDEDSIVTVISQTKYKLDWWYIIPIRKPYFSGVVLLGDDGDWRFVKPDKINEESILDEQQVFPEGIARLYGESFAYVHGFWNKLIKHKDQTELNDVPGEGNRMPYFVITKNEDESYTPDWFMALEPHGEAYGLKKILLVDGRTGKIRVWTKSQDEQAVGAVKSLEFIKSSDMFQNVKWAYYVEEEGFILIEPLPIFIEGKLYWKVTMTRTAKTGITNIILVDSSNPENIIVFKNSAQFYTYLVGKEYTETEIESTDEALQIVQSMLNKLKNIPNEHKTPTMKELEKNLESLLEYLSE